MSRLAAPLPLLAMAVVAVLLAPRALAEGPGGAASDQPINDAISEPIDEPILEDREGASRLRPEPGLLGEPTEGVEDKVIEPEPEPGEGYYGVGAHVRVATVPDFILGSFFADHPSHVGASAGLSIELGALREGAWVIELDWTSLSFPDANWRSPDTPVVGASYAEVGLHMISLDVTYRAATYLSQTVAIVYGGGLGIGGLAGGVNTAEVLPNCEPPVQQCAHWREVTFQEEELPTRVLPVIHLLTGVQVDLGKSAALRLQLGFRNVFYLGLSGGFAL